MFMPIPSTPPRNTTSVFGFLVFAIYIYPFIRAFPARKYPIIIMLRKSRFVKKRLSAYNVISARVNANPAEKP